MNGIELKGVSKKYRRRGGLFSKSDFFWALQEVSLSIKEGEVIGLVGSNGAGKTTLIQLISQITHPTEGRISIRGRLAPFIAMEDCLYPFLNVRENVELLMCLYSQKWGMSERLFERIVDFAGLGEFLETPLRQFSMGMRARLVLSMAVHLSVDFLLIDEILSVSDGNYQSLCLQKFRQLKNENKTILFVSHQLDHVRKVSDRVIWLEKGRVKEEGKPEEIINRYVGSATG